AVNYTARLEKLCSTLGRQIVLSAALAALVPDRRPVPLGAHALKDVDAPQQVFGLR
ncbi:MAG: adenylate/guanylate cyclase domain-containing protein, partial [Proteobacteria bacterium]|nr:adenylate/guanylate cyclase domain-containing protein [Pseudomonadota bacterium]